MRQVTVSNVVTIISGFAFKSNLFNENGVGVPLIRIRDINSEKSKTYYSGEYSEDYIVHNGDYLIGMDGEFNIAEWSGGKALLNQRVCRIIPDTNQIYPKYLYYFLPKELKKIEATTPFVTVKHLSVKQIKEIRIPLPSLDEQKRIATVLDRAQFIINKHKNAIIKLDEFLKSYFIWNVGPTAIDYDKWQLVRIEELANPTKGSMRTGPFGSDLKHSEFIEEAQVAVLGIDNAVNNTFTWGERRYISYEKYEQLKRYTVKPEDVIITIMGTTGRSAVVPKDIMLSITTKHLATITVDKEKILPQYLSYAIHSHPHLLQQIHKENKGAIMNGLNLTIIKNLQLKLPPIELQKEFLRVYEQIQQTKEQLQQSLRSSEEMFQSLLQKAFV